MSFAIELIQLPIVPVRLFCPMWLRTTAAHKRAGPTPWLRATAAHIGAQTLEVCKLADLRRQRAVQAVVPHAPAIARGRIEAPAAPTAPRAAPRTTQRT